MLPRIRTAIGLSLVLLLITSITTFAKGGYAFITVAGPNLKNTIRSTDPALTTDFFAFANFYRDKTNAPANPGTSYEITRFYNDGGEAAFDQLHYYPDSGFVYYDGIVNGSSEYDGKWYIAKPEIRIVFESALGITPAPKPQSVQLGRLLDQPQFFLPTIIAAGLVILLLLAYRFRRSSVH